MSVGARGHGGGVETRIAELERRQRVNAPIASVAAMGTFALTADGSATSTIVPDSAVVASSLIFFMPTSDAAASQDGALGRPILAAGSFSVSHAASTLARSYKYLVVNPA